VRQSRWRGELLDGAALAAQELGRSDLSTRLETAWRAAPTLTRLLRWLAKGDIDTALLNELEATAEDPLDCLIEADEGPAPRLITPSVVALIDRARVRSALTDGRDAVIDAMRIAAEKRVQGILEHSRRRHYGHAALLVASSVAYAPKKRTAEFLRWAVGLDEQYRRRHAFRTELARACERLGASLPA
jgi:hypothetical protein